MSEEKNRIAITTIRSAPIAIEITPHSPVIEDKSSDVELIGSGASLSDRVGDLTALISKTATGLVESLQSIADSARPKHVEAEFSIAFNAEAGFWYIAKGTASGAIKVKLEWQLPSN